VAQDEIDVSRLAVWRESHELVLAAVDRESAVVRERRIEQPERVRKVQLVEQRDAIALPRADARRRPLAHAVECENRGLLERRWKKRAGRVRFVVFRKNEAPPVLPAQRVAQAAREVQLLPDPDGQRLSKRAEATRRVREIGLQQPVEFQERLVVKRDMVERAGVEAAALETERHGLRRKPIVVFAAREALFLRRRDDLAVDDERRGRIVIVG
jgi:hypothetical protein